MSTENAWILIILSGMMILGCLIAPFIDIIIILRLVEAWAICIIIVVIWNIITIRNKMKT